jgi:excisionase family DNA binding protein
MNKSDSLEVLGTASRERALKDVAWVAAYLNVSKSWVYQAVASGVIPCVRIGALVRFDQGTIRSWLSGEGGKSTKLPSCR